MDKPAGFECAVKMCFNSDSICITLYEGGDVGFRVKTLSRRWRKTRWMYKRIPADGSVMEINQLLTIANEIQAGQLGREE